MEVDRGSLQALKGELVIFTVSCWCVEGKVCLCLVIYLVFFLGAVLLLWNLITLIIDMDNVIVRYSSNMVQ